MVIMIISIFIFCYYYHQCFYLDCLHDVDASHVHGDDLCSILTSDGCDVCSLTYDCFPAGFAPVLSIIQAEMTKASYLLLTFPIVTSAIPHAIVHFEPSNL